MAAVLHNICILAPDINPRTLMPSNTVPRYHRSNALINAGVDIKKWGTAEHVRVANDALATSKFHIDLCNTVAAQSSATTYSTVNFAHIIWSCIAIVYPFRVMGATRMPQFCRGVIQPLTAVSPKAYTAHYGILVRGTFSGLISWMTPSKLTLKF